MPISVRENPPEGPIDWCFSLAQSVESDSHSRILSITPWGAEVVIVTTGGIFIGRRDAIGMPTAIRVWTR